MFNTSKINAELSSVTGLKKKLTHLRNTEPLLK